MIVVLRFNITADTARIAYETAAYESTSERETRYVQANDVNATAD